MYSVSRIESANFSFVKCFRRVYKHLNGLGNRPYGLWWLIEEWGPKGQGGVLQSERFPMGRITLTPDIQPVLEASRREYVMLSLRVDSIYLCRGGSKHGRGRDGR